MFHCAQFNIAYSNQLKVISGIIIKHSNTQSVRFIVNEDQSPGNKSNNSQDELSTDSNKTVNTIIPEAPTNCCMSGCANCVWIEYAEKLNEIFKDGGEKARKEIMEKVTDPNIRAFLMMELRNLNLKK